MQTRSALLLIALLLGCLLGARAQATVSFSPTSAFPNRYARNVCSLIASQAESNGACQLDSAYGTSRGRVAMAFGETNCEVTLTGCVPGVCYSFRDATSTISRDDVPRPGTAGAPAASVFEDVAAVEGTSSASFTNDGFSFKASAATVKISYSVHTCADYYSYRGGVGVQECRGSFAAITEVGAGMPNSLSC